VKFKLDENLPVEINDILKKASYDSSTVFEQKMCGKSNPEIITVCNKEERALVTLDWDFANIHYYPPIKYSGIIILRTNNQSKTNLIRLTKKLLPIFKTEPLKGQLWIVEPNRIRIRGDA
jgi:predicted nuclease of predicted toxin-antitoxin system